MLVRRRDAGPVRRRDGSEIERLLGVAPVDWLPVAAQLEDGERRAGLSDEFQRYGGFVVPSGVERAAALRTPD